MIVDIGGGTADIAVISLGGTVVSASIKIAGDDFDEALVRHMRKKHNLLIGERTAEDIKIKIGSAFPRAEVDYMDVRGRNLVTGLPKTVKVSSEETEEALRETTAQIIEAIHSVLEKTPPELAADIAERGIVLTGGGFGHGIGMSQYGADAMGKEGKKWQEILGFYFKDVTFTNVFDLDT